MFSGTGTLRGIPLAMVLLAAFGASLARADAPRLGSSPDPNAELAQLAQYASMNGISCPTRTSCMAVGTTLDPNNDPMGAVALKWNGSRWSDTGAPTVEYNTNLAEDPDSLYAVSCPSAASCTAVGTAATNGGPMIDLWNGKKWSYTRGARGDKAAIPEAVSCARPTVCMVVGYTPKGPWSEISNGSKWTNESVPGKGRGSTHFDYVGSVSCSAANACTAIAGSETIGATEIVHWNGKRWSAGASADGQGSISCAAAKVCEAAGSEAGGWNGTTFTPQTLPPDQTGVTALSCPTRTVCFAVGQDPGGSTPPFADLFDAGTWSAEPMTTPMSPSGGNPPVINAVSCASAATCVAVGDYFDPDPSGEETYQDDEPFAVMLHGNSWS